MFGKPFVQALEGAFAERERGVSRVLDLRDGRATDAGKHAQFGAVELPMRKLRAQQEQGGDLSPVHRPPLSPSAASVVEQIASLSAISRSGVGAVLVIRAVPFDGLNVCSLEHIGNAAPMATSPERTHQKSGLLPV